MKTAKELIKSHEGLRLKAYPDPASGDKPWTIGYGHTKGVKKGDTCTKAQAEAWLDEDMAKAYATVDSLVKVELNTPQRDVLCSFIFNIGSGAFAKSTLLKLLNQGDYVGAANQLVRWNKASGKVMSGLTRRRKEERAMFLASIKVIEPFPQEEEMMPIASSILINALPTLIGQLPEIAAIFKKDDVSDRNIEVISKVGQILVDSTASTNVQEAVEKVSVDTEMAKVANDALRLNRADLLDLMERAWDKDEKSIQAAREFSRDDKPVFRNWLFVHILSIMFVLLGGGAAIYVLVSSEDPTERVMALQTLLIVGFASVAGFWLGSSRSSQVKDILRDPK